MAAKTATDIGARLQHAREQRGLTLSDIAGVTKISARSLNAIEQNDFGRLPGGVFRKAYVRAFAIEVGLDADEMAAAYQAKFGSDRPAYLEVTPIPAWRGPRRTVGWLTVVASIAAVVFVLLMSRAWRNSPPADAATPSVTVDQSVDEAAHTVLETSP